MCEKKPYCNRLIDDCLTKTVERINKYSSYKTLACCCGHGVYVPTIIIRNKRTRRVFEFFTRMQLTPKKRNRYYKSDKNKLYFVPEVVKKIKN